MLGKKGYLKGILYQGGYLVKGIYEKISDVVSEWILSTGFWQDSKIWIDTENWVD